MDDFKAYQRNLNLQHSYGITSERYDAMLHDQHGVCAICGKAERSKPLSVDHDHETGFIRGLLCQNCNTGLGMFNDSIRLLAGAIVYLQDHEKKLKGPR